MTPMEKKRLLKQSQRHLKAKLRFEKRLASGVRRFLKKQNNQMQEHAEIFRMQLDASINEPELTTMLEKHYSRVVARFAPEITRELNDTLSSTVDTPIETDDPIIEAALAAFIFASASDGASRITRRSNTDIATAIASTDNIADAKKTLDKKVLRRSQQIATWHTQAAAEGGKATASEASLRASNGAMFAVAAVVKRRKTWMTRIDKLVRAVHAAALFQTVDATAAFVVGGEQLLYPGDTSMGASTSNVAGCRCNAIYSTTLQ